MERKVIKAEILITRRCNLRCGYCNMPADKPEIPAGQWCEIFETLTDKLGCIFYPIYGAEPMLYSGIYRVIKFLSVRGTAYSIITNGTLIDETTWAKLLRAGLNSITLSMDSVVDLDKSRRQRETAAAKVLDLALADKIPDIQVQSTIHCGNLGQPILDLIKRLSDRNVWFSFDFIHDNKGSYAPFSKTTGYDRHYGFKPSDVENIREFLHELIEMKEGGYKIYQPLEWLNLLAKNPEMVVDRNWICPSYPAWLTVDSDGTVLVCDDYLLSSGIYATDLPDQWEEFLAFREWAVSRCRGCIWSTHWLAYRQLEGDWGVSQITHGRYIRG